MTGETGEVHLATNAIDPHIFSPGDAPPRPRSRHTLRVISYGGRDARWKGFMEMAMAMQQARNALPGRSIEWNVYGPALLPPSNEIAAYNHLGFLNPTELAAAYRSNDVLLSASWYESFPLFPIEAMACGLAVITTPYGTEDYAVNEENCLVVEPRNVQSIAQAIIRLACDYGLLERIGACGAGVANRHNWQNAGSVMDQVLRRITSAPVDEAT
jgi:glycosyltransferase involved in cell wall biosynthesis